MAAKRKLRRMTPKIFDEVCLLIAQGSTLKAACEQVKDCPTYDGFLKHLQRNDEAWEKYRQARAAQAEVMREDVIEMIRAPLPEDKQARSAEVNRRRLEADWIDKFIRNAQGPNKGIRNNAEDESSAPSSITLSWGGGNVEVSK